MRLFYVQTSLKKQSRDGERYRGFIFETNQVRDVQDFAEALSEDELVSGFRVEMWDTGGTPTVTKYPVAVSKNGVVTVSEYQTPEKFRGAA